MAKRRTIYEQKMRDIFQGKVDYKKLSMSEMEAIIEKVLNKPVFSGKPVMEIKKLY